MEILSSPGKTSTMFSISLFSKKYKLAYFLFIGLLLISCSDDSPEPETPETPEEEENAYEYLALNANGRIYSIGDITGEVNYLGQISQMRNNLNMIPNAVTSSGDKIYITEQLFDPFQTRLIEYDQDSEEVIVHNLDLPAEIFGENAGLLGLDWDDNNNRLIATVREEIENRYEEKSLLAEIDPETMQVTSLDIEITYNFTHSTALIGEKLYSLNSDQDDFEDAVMLEIDLDTKSVNEFSFTAGDANFAGALSSSGTDGFLFGFSPVMGTTNIGEALPVLIAPEEDESITITDPPGITIRHLARKSFYNSRSGEFVDLVFSSGEKLFKLNPATEDASLLGLENTGDFSTSTIIVGVREL